MSVRKRTWEIVEAAEAGDTASRVFDIAILALIFLNVIAVIVGSVQSVQQRWGAFLNVFEIVSVIIFTVEYAARLWSCTVAPEYSGRIRGQRDSRVVIAGPTTLWSILSSLQMGFRTLAIQKRSSEVWNLLGAVKTEWTKYGDVLDAVQKKLNAASDTIEKAKVRSRAVGRKLRDVQELPVGEAKALLPIGTGDDDSADDEDEGIDGQ